MNKKYAIIGLVLLLAIWMFASMNTLPREDENVNATWSQVENEYKRRTDLVPNLVSTVKAYAAHEEQVFREVTEARSKVQQITISKDLLNDPQKLNEFQKIQGTLGSALSRLIAVSERYPELKSNQNFLALQSQLEGTENRISVARRDYIEAVKHYNVTLRTFPTIIWAKLIYRDLKPKANFTIDNAETQVPKVSF